MKDVKNHKGEPLSTEEAENYTKYLACVKNQAEHCIRYKNVGNPAYVDDEHCVDSARRVCMAAVYRMFI